MRTTVLVSTVALCLLLGLAPAAAEEEEREAPPSRLWERMRRFDRNGDGQVTREEYRGPRRMFERLDADGDGTVTREEADEASREMAGRGGGSGGPERGRGLAPALLDTDGDGQVSKAEWEGFFEKADENEDGLLQAEEWVAAATGRPLSDPAPRVGDAAPAVTARALVGGEVVDLARPRRATVLVFGSWT